MKADDLLTAFLSLERDALAPKGANGKIVRRLWASGLQTKFVTKETNKRSATAGVTTRAVLFLLFALALASLGVGGFYEYRAVHLPPVATGIVKNASLRIDDCMSYEVQPSNITFAEMLAKLQKNVTELDSKLIDLQSAQTARNASRVKPLLDYLHAGMAALRAQGMVTQKEMETRSRIEQRDEAYRQSMSGSASEYASRTVERAREDLRKTLHEYANAEETLKRSLDSLLSSRKDALAVVPTSTLCNPDLVAKVQNQTDSNLKQIAISGQ